MKSMFPRNTCSLIVLSLVLLIHAAAAETTALYLLNGTVVRGEIVARSARTVQLKTPSGTVTIKTARLMPISRAQLKLPAEIEPDEAPEMEAILAQMEKLIAENEALKKQIEALKQPAAKNNGQTAMELKSPAEGPAR